MSRGIKVILTGAKGFIGSHAYNMMLKRGHYVTKYDLLDGNDVLDVDKLDKVVAETKPYWIVHLAGQVFLQPSLDNPQKDAYINIIGIINVLEVARKYGCGVIFSSSGAVYGNNYQYPNPISPYGVSKLTAERYCMLYKQLYNLTTIVFRFSSIYGFGRKRTSVNLILDKIVKDETVYVTGDGNQTRDFTYVSDVAEALCLAVENKFPSGHNAIYDIGTGTTTTLNELINCIGVLLKKTPTIEYTKVNPADPKRNALNVSKAEMFGFKAKVSLVDGLKKLIAEEKKCQK